MRAAAAILYAASLLAQAGLIDGPRRFVSAWARFLVSEIGTGEAPEGAFEAAKSQVGHIALGIVGMGLAYHVALAATGVVAGKLVLILAVMTVATIIEAWQGIRARRFVDPACDLWFWAVGAIGCAYAFSEVGPGQVAPDPGGFFAALAGAVVSLVVYLTPRVLRQHGAE